MTPNQHRFLEAALADGNRVVAPGYGNTHWKAGPIRMFDHHADALVCHGWIERVKSGDGPNTVRVMEGDRHVGFLYRVTSQGKDALNARRS